MQKVLAVENLHKTFLNGQHKLEVLRGITAGFCQGQSYAIMGVSGSGKSTFMHVLAGLAVPNSGIVTFNNENILTATADFKDKFLQSSVGLVFQVPYLIAELSVLENVMLRGLLAGKSLGPCRQRAMELLESVGLADKSLSKPLSLSGGQQQRVSLARAIFSKPAFLIADEPTGSLDEYTRRDIVELLLKCQREWEMGIIVSSHDEYVAQSMDVLYQLKDGLLIPK